MGKVTENALLSRKFDSLLASRLSNAGFTISKLKGMSEEQLQGLGVDMHLIQSLRESGRSKIPTKNLLSVLYKSKRTCCICRDVSKAVVVHHIKEWSKSRDHSEENLVALCLEHHDLAHTKKELSQNLTVQEIKNAKLQWEATVSERDIATIFQLKHETDFARWDWINIRRVFELLNRMNFSLKNTDYFQNLIDNEVINERGILKDEKLWAFGKEYKHYFIDFYEGSDVAFYLSTVLEYVAQQQPFIDITPILSNITQLRALVEQGRFITAQARFYFKAIKHKDSQKTEIKRAHYRGHGVKIEFTYEPWYCMSSSARYSAMYGNEVITILGIVRSISKIEGELVISVSCLGVGTAFKRHVGRISSQFMN